MIKKLILLFLLPILIGCISYNDGYYIEHDSVFLGYIEQIGQFDDINITYLFTEDYIISIKGRFYLHNTSKVWYEKEELYKIRIVSLNGEQQFELINIERKSK